MTHANKNFGSDNVTPASQEVMEAIIAANSGALNSYGDDPFTERLTTRVSATFEKDDLVVYPVATGTAANSLALSALSPPYGAVYCHESAHILTDECGAPEFYTGGAKIIGLPSVDGKLIPAQLKEPLSRAAELGVHHVMPAALSLTQSTEWGTVYAPDEVRALSEAAHAHGLGVHMDGSRIANAVAHLGCSPAEITWKAGIDVLCLGATKNGALAAEAVVFFNRSYAAGFDSRQKRGGHLWAKMRFLSTQLLAYLEAGLWLRNAAHANAMATRLAAGLATLPAIEVVHPVQSNELFCSMPEAVLRALCAEGYEFHRWPVPHPGPDPVIRLVTAFCTTTVDVDTLISAASRFLRDASCSPR